MRVVRDASSAVIVHDCEPSIAVRIELGPRAATLSDDEVVDRYVQRLCALGAQLVATPQLRWDETLQRWLPRGRAIRCIVEGIEEPVVVVEDVELTLADLGGLLAGHGAEICVVLLDE